MARAIARTRRASWRQSKPPTLRAAQAMARSSRRTSRRHSGHSPAQSRLFCRRRGTSQPPVGGRKTRPRHKKAAMGGKPCGDRGAPLLNRGRSPGERPPDGRPYVDQAANAPRRGPVERRSICRHAARMPLALRAHRPCCRRRSSSAALLRRASARAGQCRGARLLPPIIPVVGRGRSLGAVDHGVRRRRGGLPAARARSCPADCQPVASRLEPVFLALADVIVFFVSGLTGVASIQFIAANLERAHADPAGPLPR